MMLNQQEADDLRHLRRMDRAGLLNSREQNHLKLLEDKLNADDAVESYSYDDRESFGSTAVKVGAGALAGWAFGKMIS